MSSELSKAQQSIARATLAIEQLTPRSESETEERRDVYTALFEVRALMEKATNATELQEALQKAEETRRNALALLQRMPPPQGRFLIEDGYLTLAEYEAKDAGDLIAYLPDRRECTIDGELVLKVGKSEVTIPHGTPVTIKSYSGYMVEITLESGVKILLAKEDFPSDGLPIMEKPRLDQVGLEPEEPQE